MGDLSLPCRKIGQGHLRVMIYANLVELYSQMLHAKFQNHRLSGSVEADFLKVFAIYRHGDCLGHVNLTIYTHFHSHFLILPRIKSGFDWTSSFRKEDVLIFWSYTCI